MNPDPPPRRRYRLPASLRLKRRDDMRRLFERGLRLTDQRLTMWGLPNDRPYSRFGVSVGTRHGNAVQRNRAKRLLREAFRLSRHELPPGLDLVCAPRSRTPLDLAGCVESLSRLAGRLAGRFR